MFQSHKPATHCLLAFFQQVVTPWWQLLRSVAFFFLQSEPHPPRAGVNHEGPTIRSKSLYFIRIVSM